MNIPCPTSIACPCSDNPFANLSSEPPDVDWFVGLNWGWGNNQPRLGSNWQANHCLGVCQSNVSQADADLCAAINNLNCMIGTWGTPPPIINNTGGPVSGPPLVPPPFTGETLKYNTAQSCTSFCSDGSPFTFFVAAGIFPSTTQEGANEIAHSVACQNAALLKFCLSGLTSRACLNTAFLDSITVNKPGGYSFTISSGSLPPGLTMAGNGVISGTPTATGPYTFSVTANNGAGLYMVKTYTINVLGITTASLPNGTDSVAYSETLTASGGTAPYTFALELGPLPDGITLASNGTLSGTPTEVGTFPLTFSVTDSALGFCTKELTLTINPGACPSAILTVVTGVFGGGYAVACIGTGEIAHPDKLYTMDIGFNKIVVMDLATDAIVGSFASSGGFNLFNFGVAVPSHNRFFYDAHDAGGLTHYVGMQNLTTNAAIAPIGPNANAYEFWKYDPVVDLVFCAVTDFADFSKKKVFSLNPTTGVKSAEITVGTNLDATWGMCYISTLDKFCTSRVDSGSVFFLETWDRVTGALGVSLNTGTFFVQQSIYLPGTNRLYVVAQDQVSTAYFLHIYDPLTLALVKSIALHPTDTYDGLCFSAATGLVIISGVDTVAYVNTVSETLLCTYALTTPNFLNATYLNKFYASGQFANNIEEFQ